MTGADAGAEIRVAVGVLVGVRLGVEVAIWTRAGADDVGGEVAGPAMVGEAVGVGVLETVAVGVPVPGVALVVA